MEMAPYRQAVSNASPGNFVSLEANHADYVDEMDLGTKVRNYPEVEGKRKRGLPSTLAFKYWTFF